MTLEKRSCKNFPRLVDHMFFLVSHVAHCAPKKMFGRLLGSCIECKCVHVQTNLKVEDSSLQLISGSKLELSAGQTCCSGERALVQFQAQPLPARLLVAILLSFCGTNAPWWNKTRFRSISSFDRSLNWTIVAPSCMSKQRSVLCLTLEYSYSCAGHQEKAHNNKKYVGPKA